MKKEREIEAYVKYIGFHLEQTEKFKNDAFRKENLIYNPEGDYYVCLVGQKLMKNKFRHLIIIPRKLIGHSIVIIILLTKINREISIARMIGMAAISMGWITVII